MSIDNVGFPPEGVHTPTIQDVIIAAEVAKNIANSMGGNGSENNDIEAIVQRARDGVLDAATAIIQIQAIPENKHGNGGHGLMG